MAQTRESRFVVGGSQAHEWLSKHLRGASEIRIAVAYVDRVGIEFLESLLASDPSSRCWLLMGGSRDGTYDPNLTELLSQVHERAAGRFSVREMPSKADSFFHPKDFIFHRADGENGALVGSNNLTGPGLGKNVELAFHVRDMGAAVFELSEQFKQWWDDGKDIRVGGIELGTGPLLPTPKTSPPLPPRTPRERIINALGRTMIVDPVVSMRGCRLRLPAGLLGLHEMEEFEGELLTFRAGTDLGLSILPKETRRRADALRQEARRRLRSFSLRSPWGRLVPHALQHELGVAMESFKDEVNDLHRSLLAELDRPAARIAASLGQDLQELWPKMKHTGSPPSFDEVSESIVRQVSERIAQLRLAPVTYLEARFRYFSVPIANGDPARTGDDLRNRFGDCFDEYLRQFVITAASAPRRSLLNHRNPKRAIGLCLLDDLSLKDACEQNWGAKEPETKRSTRQRGVLDGRSLGEVEATLRDQVTQIHTWYGEPLAEVLREYERLISAGSPDEPSAELHDGECGMS